MHRSQIILLLFIVFDSQGYSLDFNRKGGLSHITRSQHMNCHLTSQLLLPATLQEGSRSSETSQHKLQSQTETCWEHLTLIAETRGTFTTLASDSKMPLFAWTDPLRINSMLVAMHTKPRLKHKNSIYHTK